MDQHHTIGFVQEGHVSRAVRAIEAPPLTYCLWRINMNKKLRHQDRVLNYIKEFGSITSAECFTELGIIDLPKKICLFQDEGYVFKKEPITKKNRYGDSTTYKRYSLETEAD